MIKVMIIAYSIFIPVLLFISGFAKAVMDLSEEGKIKLKPSRYWIKSMSSPNKWKDGDPRKGEKFFGSSRWFVALTDAWHLFGLIERLSFVITYTSIGVLIMLNKWFAFMLLCYPLSMLSFHLFYNSKILRK